MKKRRTADMKRKGMSLALTLLVLLVAGAMVAVSMYFIENMMMTTQMNLDSELRMNAAIAGVEKGKQWILAEIAANKGAPKLDDPKIKASEVTETFDRFILKSEDLTTPEGVSVSVRVFDLVYDVGSEDIDFERGMPPQILKVFTEDMSQSSQIKRQSYDTSNRGGGSPENLATFSGVYHAYLIRSSAALNGISKTIEQSVYLKK